MNTYQFKQPNSLFECEQRITEMVMKIQDIDTDLGNPINRDYYGDNYHDWRNRALRAKTLATRCLRDLKAWKLEQVNRQKSGEAVIEAAIKLVHNDCDENFHILCDVVSVYESEIQSSTGV